ncbi:nuclear receptor coactivator 7 [Austrofundulus limnaeus]|uniref:Nuclear receptor coactivator 7 n=1 Tax=Austrofundulus limnaeus TaxID=52670 RepID=A0A2I4ATJ6_AUSLI|nr:PREDICTED: nuclear receptor coactivator 7-like [Austrofundulus limnaeus]
MIRHIYVFFVEWSPDIYTKGKKKRHESGYENKEKDPNRHLVADKVMSAVNKIFSKPLNIIRKILTVRPPGRRRSLCSSVESEENEQQEYENALPVLSDPSSLLHDHHLQKLAAHMPARTQGYQWNLVYSTAVHGSSLKTLYRNMADLQSPVLLVIKDMHNKVFGAFSSDPFRVSNYFYGTGETFLFSFNPDFQKYTWSGENSYFMSGNWESLHIGGGGGGFGLWLDADLYHGASFSCPTFHNAPLSTHEDFIVQDIEVWTVQN